MHPDELFSILHPPLSRSELARLNLDEIPFFRQGLVLEFAFWIVVLLLAAILLKTRPAFFQKIEAWGKNVARKQGLVVGMIVLTALVLRAVLLIAIPYPDPVVHDEYSYLLQAATFASGKITNPTPPGWEHFETFHVNMRPTYQSMYPPGQALFLAAAEVVGAHPWWGVWLSVGIMCGALCWMLQGWLPPHWAFLGGLFCVIRFSTFSYWVNSYWGGAVSAIGGALVLGSLPRLKRNPRARYVVLFVLGLAFLANTRPYEGFIFSLPAVAALVICLGGAWKRSELKFATLIPGIALLIAVAIAAGYYNWRSTGNPTFMPYMANHQQYHITRPFIWQTRLPVPEYRHQVMRTFYVFHELPDYLNRANPDGYSRLIIRGIRVYYDFFIWPMFIPAVFAMWSMMKSRKMRIFPITLLLVLAALLVEQWPAHDHYAAPVLGAVLMVVIYGLRLLRTWRPKGVPWGPMLVRSAVLTVFAFALSALALKIINPLGLSPTNNAVPAEIERARLMSRLEQVPGKHLVFVHFRVRERGSYFWIYNDPDLDRSKIIWAHDMGEAENQQLIRLYPNRQVWIVNKDDVINPLVPYSQADQLAGFMPPPHLDSGASHAQ
jgi:hypothetical protein